jgi:myo-inositol-1(or 4)-monophosphatase
MRAYLKTLSKEAGKILLSYQNKKNRIRTKKDKSFVSDADLASEEHILKSIDKYFPGSNIISEESGKKTFDGKGSGLTWIIDPIDGTTNFLHSFPLFSVSIGVFEKGKPLAGAVYNPALDELYLAERGKGAFLNDAKIKVSSIDKLENSLLITGFYYHEGERLKTQMERFRVVQERSKSVRRLGAASIDVCYVASGRVDAFWEDGLKCWDIAAGSIILKESGGVFTDIMGNKGDIFGETFLFSNKKLHREMIKILK